MKKLSLLLLDANVVIQLFQSDVWERVIESCDVHLAATIIEHEAHFYEDAKGERHDFDLSSYVSAGTIRCFQMLGNLDRRAQGISLEEILNQIGYGRPLPHEYSKSYRDRWTSKGFEERLLGIGARKQ
jgi:hypothetical protein